MNLLRDIFIWPDLCHGEDTPKKERKKGRKEKQEEKKRGRSLEERRRSGSLNSFQCVAPGVIFLLLTVSMDM